MSEEQKTIQNILGEMEELLNRAHVDNNVYANKNPQVHMALNSIGGALMDLTARITRLFQEE